MQDSNKELGRQIEHQNVLTSKLETRIEKVDQEKKILEAKIKELKLELQKSRNQGATSSGTKTDPKQSVIKPKTPSSKDWIEVPSKTGGKSCLRLQVPENLKPYVNDDNAPAIAKTILVSTHQYNQVIIKFSLLGALYKDAK